MQLIKTIKTNSRDIIVGIGLVVSLALIADIIERIAITSDGAVWLANVVSALAGLSNFAAANLAAWFMLAVAWPSFNRFSNESFYAAWGTFDLRDRFVMFLGVASVQTIAAAICFS